MSPTTISSTPMIARIRAPLRLPDDVWVPDWVTELTLGPPRDIPAPLSVRAKRLEENLSPALAPGAEKVTDHVLAESVRQGAEHPAAVPSRHFVDKSGQPFVLGQHEYVQ